MQINLLYAAKPAYGGWVTYTAHLYHLLKNNGHLVQLLKVSPSNKTEQVYRDFGYGIKYRNVSVDFLKKSQLLHVTALDKNHYAIIPSINHAVVTVHDPNELKSKEMQEFTKDNDKIITIRPSTKKLLPLSTLTIHPYISQCSGDNVPWGERKIAVTLSRMDFDKKTHDILTANRMLDEKNKIELRGAEVRCYTFRKLMPNFEEFVQDSHRTKQNKMCFPKTMNAATELASQYKYMVDLSTIKNDGGGSQYTFLEAWDAGSIPVLHNDWIMPGGEMVPLENCLTVDSPESLVKLLTNGADLMCTQHILQKSKHYLKKHQTVVDYEIMYERIMA